MKQKIFFLIGLLVFVALIIGTIRMFVKKAPKQGELRVESTPVASVFLENKHIGRTPIGSTSYKVDAGEYTIKIVPESGTNQYASWQGTIKIGPNMLTYVNATLSESELSSAVNVLWLEPIASKKSEITVTTTPDSATVMLDDDIKGMTPITIPDIVSGNHTLTVTSQGFLTRTEKVQLTSGYKLVTAMKLALAPGGIIEEVTTSATISGTPTPKTTGKPVVTATTADPAKPYALIKDTPTGFLNVRLEPMKTASKAGEVKPGEKFSYEKTASDSAGTIWYQITYEGTKTGWISGQYVTKIE